MKKYKITVNGTSYEVEVEEISAETNGAVIPQVSAPAAPAMAPKASAPVDGTPVKSPMPGTILKVNTAAGSSIKKGEVILVLEAMKMENDIVAPCDGTVKSIKVSQGQSVNTGDIIAIIG